MSYTFESDVGEVKLDMDIPKTESIVPHCFSDFWRNPNKGFYRLKSIPSIYPSVQKKYGKTAGIYTSKYKRKKCRENKQIFALGTHVEVRNRTGIITDSYTHENIIFYQIEWDEPRKTWYDDKIGKEAARFGWSEARFIKKSE